MKNYLVGCTGFVGSNIAATGKFDGMFHSTNIQDAFGGCPDLLVFAGLPAEKFLANTHPELDKQKIENAFKNIQKINPKQMVLISTIDVYEQPFHVDENTVIETQNLPAYGKNRFFLECMVREKFSNALIVRLPGLYGKNMKKNFLFDLLHPIPSVLSDEKFTDLSHKNHILKEYYINQNNGFWKCILSPNKREKKLEDAFTDLGFSSLQFTDSRAKFQFYPLRYLWDHIQIALENKITLLNLATEPLETTEIYQKVTGKKFENQLNKLVPNYNFQTIHASLFSGQKGYIFTKGFILEDILNFLKEEGDKIK